MIICNIFLDLGETLMKQSVVAEVNGELWDMHRPLQENCSLKFFQVKTSDPQQAYLVNKTFWRSCSFLLGAVIENAFLDGISVVLHSFPSANSMNFKQFNCGFIK